MSNKEAPSSISALKAKIELGAVEVEDIKALEVLKETFDTLQDYTVEASNFREGAKRAFSRIFGVSEEEGEARFDTEIIKGIIGQETHEKIKRFTDECIQYLGPEEPRPGEPFVVWTLYKAPRIMFGQHEKYQAEVGDKKYETVGYDIKWFGDFEKDEVYYEDEEWIDKELTKEGMLADKFVEYMEKILDQLKAGGKCADALSTISLTIGTVAEELKKESK